jgi:hypothetical protein
MDPVLTWILRAGLAALFATAALHKLGAPREFARTVRDYRLLPAWLTPGFVAALIGLEAVTAVLLLSTPLAWLGASSAALLLSAYSIAIATNLARGRRHIDCGCLGPHKRQSISGWLVARNALLLVGTALSSAAPISRALGWVDGISIAGGLLGLVLLFHAANLLASLHPHLDPHLDHHTMAGRRTI